MRENLHIPLLLKKQVSEKKTVMYLINIKNYRHTFGTHIIVRKTRKMCNFIAY